MFRSETMLSTRGGMQFEGGASSIVWFVWRQDRPIVYASRYGYKYEIIKKYRIGESTELAGGSGVRFRVPEPRSLFPR